jgi:hypothetical protein
MSETINVGDPSPELVETVATLVAVAGSYAGGLTCVEQRTAIGNDLRDNKRLQKLVEDERVKITGPINVGLRAVNALFKRMSEPLETAERTMKRVALAWDTEQDRIKARAVREAARIADEERAKLREAANIAGAEGKHEVAHALAEAAQMIAPVPVAVEQAKVEGEAHQIIWRAECFDDKLVCRAIGDGSLGLTEDEQAECRHFFAQLFRKRAAALHDALNIPGVRAVSERILKSRAA